MRVFYLTNEENNISEGMIVSYNKLTQAGNIEGENGETYLFYSKKKYELYEIVRYERGGVDDHVVTIVDD